MKDGISDAYNEAKDATANAYNEAKNATTNAYNEAKEAFDKISNRVTAIIQQCIDGVDPEVADYAESCSGSCSTCGGCG